MESLQDPDLNVRRATLAFFNSAVHNKPSLVRDLLDDILPFLYQETKIRRDLIREVKPRENTARSPQTGLLGLGRGLGSGSSEEALAHRVQSARVSWRCEPGQGSPNPVLASVSPNRQKERHNGVHMVGLRRFNELNLASAPNCSWHTEGAQ